MAGVARLGDRCSGHGCWPPRPSIEGSPSVFVNGRPALRVGDRWAVHCCPEISECHGSVQAAGSSTVFVEGRALARVGDAVACGTIVAEGSDDVFAAK